MRVLLLRTVDYENGLIKGREFTGDRVYAERKPLGWLDLRVLDDRGRWVRLKGQQAVTLPDPKESAMRDNCKHVVSVENDGGNCYVELSNDNDGYYVQQFSSSRELKDFIGELLAAHDEAFVTDGTVTRLLTLRIVQPEPRPFLDDYEVEADDG